MRIAITGATGFLGRYLIQACTDAGHEVTAWYRSSPIASLNSSDVRWVQGELGNPTHAQELVQSADAVIHSGLYRGGKSFLDSGDDPLLYWQRNATGSLQLLEAAVGAGVEKFVFVSSGAVHQHVLQDRQLDETHPLLPGSLYGACKASVETLVHYYGTSGKIVATALRPTSIYGAAEPISESKWFDLVQQVCRGQNIDATGGSKAVHASDVAKSALLLLEQDDSNAGETFNCCDRMISEFEVATIAKRISGSNSSIKGPEKVAKNQIVTNKLCSIGMQFGGTALLEQTVAQLVSVAANN